jgi:hypothetical protein
MNVQTVKTEISTLLATIPGIRAFDWGKGSGVPPMALVGWPDEVQYVQTYGRGQTRIPDLAVLVGIGKVSERTAAVRLGAYLDETGAQSIPAKIESRTGAWVACDVVTVTSAKIMIITLGGVDYLAAEFHLDITGKGA